MAATRLHAAAHPAGQRPVHPHPAGNRVLKQQQEVVGFDGTRYLSRLLLAASSGGVQVPVSVAYRGGELCTHPVLRFRHRASLPAAALRLWSRGAHASGAALLSFSPTPSLPSDAVTGALWAAGPLNPRPKRILSFFIRCRQAGRQRSTAAGGVRRLRRQLGPGVLRCRVLADSFVLDLVRDACRLVRSWVWCGMLAGSFIRG